MRLFLRLNILIFSLSLLFAGLSLGLGKMQVSHGTLVFNAGVGNQLYEVFVDYDARMLLTQPYPFGANNPSAIVEDERLYFFDNGESRAINLDRAITPVLARWDSSLNAIFMIYRRGDDAFIGTVDTATDAVNSTVSFPNFKLGFAVMSPDRRYILLREEGLVRPIPVPKPMLLYDTLTGERRDFGNPAFAYWSPDSQFLALGYKEAERYESRVERYTVATAERLQYPVLASQEDTPFFYTNGFRSNGILWSPDSRKMVVMNRDTESLYFVGEDGAILEVNGGRITPLRWSPDSRFLLGVGYANGEVGAFVVDSETGVINRLQSPVVLQDALSDFAWSSNSRYVAVLTHSSGVLFEQRLTLYDTNGLMIGSPVELQTTIVFASMDGTLRWLD